MPASVPDAATLMGYSRASFLSVYRAFRLAHARISPAPVRPVGHQMVCLAIVVGMLLLASYLIGTVCRLTDSHVATKSGW